MIAMVAGGAIPLFAHEAEGGSTAGLFGLKAEYLHVLLNPLPVFGLLAGTAVLLTGLVTRSRITRNTGLILTILCAGSAFPVLFYGQHGYNHLAPQLDTESKQWLDVHMDRAERFVYAFYLMALLGIAALVLQKKFPKASTVLPSFTLVSAIISLGIGGWISRAGGQISHSEFREEGAAPTPPSTPHGAHQHGEEKMQVTNAGGHHEHGTSGQSPEKMRSADETDHKHGAMPEQTVEKAAMPARSKASGKRSTHVMANWNRTSLPNSSKRFSRSPGQLESCLKNCLKSPSPTRSPFPRARLVKSIRRSTN